MTGLPIRKPHRIESYRPVALAIRGYERWRSFNRVLWWMSAVALTRALLYTRSSPSTTAPQGLDLLPNGVLLGFGMLWLAAAILGFVGAVIRDGVEVWARRALAGMYMGWAVIYFALSLLYPSSNGTFLLGAWVWAILCFTTFGSNPEVRYVNLVVATEAMVGRPKGGRRFLVFYRPDRRRVNLPVEVDRRHAPE